MVFLFVRKIIYGISARFTRWWWPVTLARLVLDAPVIYRTKTITGNYIAPFACLCLNLFAPPAVTLKKRPCLNWPNGPKPKPPPRHGHAITAVGVTRTSQDKNRPLTWVLSHGILVLSGLVLPKFDWRV